MRVEFAVRAETHQGVIVTLKSFTTSTPAYDYRVRLADWKRVWVQKHQIPDRTRTAPTPDPVVLPGGPTVERIQEAVAQKFGMTREVLLSSSRIRERVRPRQIAMYLALQLVPSLTLADMARSFGADRKTAWHGMRKIKELRAIDAEINNAVTELEAALRQEAPQ